MADSSPPGPGRGPADITKSHTRMPAAALAVLALFALVLIVTWPRSSSAASLQAIQANIGEKQAAIEQRARPRRVC